MSIRDAVGRLPLTNRSSSSLETPRTGGGFTGRSSGERGTPRDAQRLALGERPREADREAQRNPDGWVGAPILSPQHTARSAALSSEAVSMTPSAALSSEGDSVSSSRIDSVPYGDDPNGAYASYYGAQVGNHDHSHNSASQDACRLHLDLQKNLEVMRFVIMRENQKLQDSLQQVHDQLGEVRKEVENGVRPQDQQHMSSISRPRSIAWHVQNVGEAALKLAGAGERKEFTMLEYPGVVFMCTFRKLWSGSCELRLEVSGDACQGLDLRIVLGIDTDNSSSGDAIATTSALDVVATLRNGGFATCTRSWPVGAPIIGAGGASCGDIVCRVEVERVNLHSHADAAQPLEMQSEWQATH